MNEMIIKIEKLISEQLEVENVTLCGSGTEGFINILSKINLSSDDEILIPNFLCEILMIPIIKKVKYKLVDVKQNGILPSLNEYKQKASPNTKIILISYLWGYIHEDLEDIISWCKINNFIIIEDISSAYMLKYKNLKLGTLGDYAFGSFGHGKFVDIGKYGFIISKYKIDDNKLLKGKEFLNYTKIIKKIRNIKSRTLRIIFTKFLFKHYFFYLKTEYDFNSLNLLYFKLKSIKKIYKKIEENTKIFINELRNCNNIDILIPNNDMKISTRVACVCKNNEIIKKLKANKCWVGTDYSMPINKMLNYEIMLNCTMIEKNIMNLLTNVSNNTIKLTIDLIRKDGENNETN